MYFGKIPHPENFRFLPRHEENRGFVAEGGAALASSLEKIGPNAWRLRVETGSTARYSDLARYEEKLEGEGACTAKLGDDGALVLEGESGERLLAGKPGTMLGVCGSEWLLQFEYDPQMKFYGFGEHCRGFEKTGRRAKFWNTDVWGDYPLREVFEGEPESLYVSIPWMILRSGDAFAGILVRHPGAVFFDAASNFVWDGKNRDDADRNRFYVGAPDGPLDVYFLAGPTLPELTRRMQKLVGTTPLPPLWALGHHQCRWGYASPEDLRELDRKYEECAIPCDGLWLDIEYMDGYRVFSFDPALWGGTEDVKAVCVELAKKGRRVVPILDPGLKADPGYPPSAEALAKDLFCHAPSGKPFTGFVWPGKTWMPDFSLPETRAWWAANVREFASKGPSGAWLDMNDPSVGAAELWDMRFQHGEQPHKYAHNEYALGMAQASRNGFLAARPDERPFLLSRSASPTMSREAAVWTGDNYSNRHHLKMAIPVSLNLALSGIPFNGPDVPGFGGEASAELAAAWYKCGFLFPFFRNHSERSTPRKEPWQFGEEALAVIARYIRLRYKFLPYLYNLWIAQEEAGEAVMRPLFYDFADTPELPLSHVDDAFMVGPSVLHAPVLEEGALSRKVPLPSLPEGGRWFSAIDGGLLAGGAEETVAAAFEETPLFFREGALLPLLPGVRRTAKSDLSLIELHAILFRDSQGEFRSTYAFDDGASYAYKRGERTSARFLARVEEGGRVLRIVVESLAEAYKPLAFRVVAYDAFEVIRIEYAGKFRDCVPGASAVTFAGKEIRTFVSSAWSAAMAGR